jgi:hypothetical protein
MYDQATLLASTNSARSLQLIDSILILSPQSELALKALLLQSDVLRTDKKFQQALSSLQRITPFTRQKNLVPMRVMYCSPKDPSIKIF